MYLSVALEVELTGDVLIFVLQGFPHVIQPRNVKTFQQWLCL